MCFKLYPFFYEPKIIYSYNDMHVQMVDHICHVFQFEWLTGGDCRAGMHEVVVSKKTVDAIHSAVQDGRCLWRVSSTVCRSLLF